MKCDPVGRPGGSEWGCLPVTSSQGIRHVLLYNTTIILEGNNDSDDDERMVRTGMPLLVYIGAAWTPGEQFGSGVSPIASSTF